MSEVGNLLARSRAEHANYQRANRAGDRVREKAYIQAALALREQAHGLDPHHDDDGWLDDQVSHEAIIDFYALYLQEATAH
jgi:hypothetical protein